MYKYAISGYTDIYHILEFMSSLGKITSFNDIENLVEVDPIEVSPHSIPKTRKNEHNQKISDSLKAFNDSDEGKKLREHRSERMRRFYESPQGESIRKKLSVKCGRPKKKAIDRAIRKHIVWEHMENGKKITELAEHYNVSRASIYRYIKEFT